MDRDLPRMDIDAVAMQADPAIAPLNVVKEPVYSLRPPPGDPSDAGDGVGGNYDIPGSDLYLNPYYGETHLSAWFPNPERSGMSYGDQGIEGSTQVWIAPYWTLALDGEWVPLPVALRQLMSWNREKYQRFNRFADHYLVLDNSWIPPTENYMVPVRVTARPRIDMPNTALEEAYQKFGEPTSYGIVGYAGLEDSGEGFSADVFEATRLKDRYGQALPEQNTFPSICGQWWEVEVQFAPDKYYNRFGYRYCKIDVKPTTRLESIKNLPLGIVPTNSSGNPNFDIVDAENTGKSDYIDTTTTGFPVREGQIEIVMSYPWVSIRDLLEAGPIGNPDQLPKAEGGDLTFGSLNPHNMSPGQLLGTVNSDPFLGFSRGRVLYSAAEIEESRSPVTGNVGYRVSNHFLVNTMMEWNQVRYMPKDKSADVQEAISSDMTPTWPTGFMVLMDKSKGSNIIYKYRVANSERVQAIYPYPYREWSKLAYYGRINTVDPFDPTTSDKA